MAKSDKQGGAGGLNSEQLQNARIIIQVGRQLGMSNRDVHIALITAMQESRLRNLDYGDRDSIGLFQQRNAWGSRSARLDPYQSARMFFLGGADGQRGLRDIGGRNNIPMWKAAQAVQVSAFPRAYQQWEMPMGALIQRVGGEADVMPQPSGPIQPGPLLQQPNPFMTGTGAFDTGIGDDFASAMDKLLQDGIGDEIAQAPQSELTAAAQPLGIGSTEQPLDLSQFVQDQGMPSLDGQTKQAMQDTYPGFNQLGNGGAEGMRSAVINLASKYVGKVPYKWGAESPDEGFDCSGLIQYVFGQMGISMPRLGHNQAQKGVQTSINKLRAGDLVYWPGQHIAIYLGNGQILEAPRPGKMVKIRELGEWSEDRGAVGIKLDY